MSQDTDNTNNDVLPLDFVTVEVCISPDKMAAHLVLTPCIEESSGGVLTVAHLEAVLEDAGVIRGIIRSALDETVVNWNRDRCACKTSVVARGKAATPEKTGTLRMAVKHLAAQGDITFVIDHIYFWEVASLADKFQRVDHGTVIAKRAPSTPSLLGYDVYGAPIFPVDPPNADHEGRILELNNVFMAGLTYSASKTGVAYFDANDELPKVIPLNFDCAVELSVTPNAMLAELAAYPAGERGTVPSETHIRSLLKSKGIVFGINDEEIAYLMKQFSQGITEPLKLVIAEGQPAIKGDNGYIEFGFNTESSPTPALNPDGSVDYKTINMVTFVEAGEVLATLLPPTNGIPGMDLYGRVLPALNGIPAKLPVGAGTAIPAENRNTLVAVTSGIARFDGSAVNISEGYVIAGNIDYTTGNITYKGSVAVKGDVLSGFAIECAGDLQVNGIIEDCKLQVGGNLLCRYGFVGRGSGVAEIKGDANFGYMKNQTVIADGNVNIAKEAINCVITAHKSIRVYGHTLSVAGGVLSSAEAIVVKTVGNINGIQTTLQITPPLELVRALAVIKSEIDTRNANIEKIKQVLGAMTRTQNSNTEQVRKLKAAIIAIGQQIVELENNARKVSCEMGNYDNVFIRVDRIAYPGTILKIGDRTMSLTDILTGGKTIKIIEHEMKVL